MGQKMCESCGVKPVTGRAVYCSPKCRKTASRNKLLSAPETDVKVHGVVIPDTDIYKLSQPTYFEPEAPSIFGGSAETFAEPPDETENELGVGDDVEDKILEESAKAEEKYDAQANLEAFQQMGLDKVTWITTGIPAFDKLTMIPRGRVTQIQGPYAVGKTTLCLNMIRGLKGHKVLYIDSEASLSIETLLRMKIEAEDFTLYNQSAYIEDIADLIVASVKKPAYDIIILDSLAATTFRVEAANEIADANIGQKAKIVGKLMRLIPNDLRKTNTALVIVNQERETIGNYGPLKYTPGGSGVLFAASLIIALRSNKSMRFMKDGKFIGQKVEAEIIKSRVNDPWRKATFKIYYGN